MGASTGTIALGALVSMLEPRDAAGPEPAPSATVAITFQAYSSNPAAVGVGRDARLKIDAVWLSAHDLGAWPKDACAERSARSLRTGALAVELVKPTSQAGTLATGRYCALAFALRRASKGGRELRGASLVLLGRRADGVRFELRSSLAAAIELSAVSIDGFAVGASGTSWIVGADLTRWLANVDLDMVEPTEQGRVLRIDERTNSELLAAFDASVAAGLGVYADVDGDRVLDPDELREPIAKR